jgi:membrane protease YdiL (CAAX protease family)
MAPLPPPPPAPPRIPPPAPPPTHIERTEYDHGLSRWGIGDALLSMVIFFVFSLAVGLIAISQSSGDALDGFWLPLAIVSPAVVQLGYVVWVGGARGRGVVTDFRLKFTLSDLGIGAGLCISGLILAGIVATGIFQIFDVEPTATAAEVVQDSEADSGLTIWIYVFAILASTLTPLIEELVFRGLWWSALEKRGLHPILVLTITSGIFALVHLEPIRTPVLFVLGMTIGLGRLVTGRIGASIAAHMYVNGIAMTFLLIELS